VVKGRLAAVQKTRALLDWLGLDHPAQFDPELFDLTRPTRTCVRSPAGDVCDHLENDGDEPPTDTGPVRAHRLLGGRAGARP